MIQNKEGMKKLYSKLELSTLFQRTKRYHKRRLREMFREHYEPSRGDEWTVNLSDEVVQDLRLHLSWVEGLNVFHWGRRHVGKEILNRFDNSGILIFLIHVIKNDKKIT